MRQVDGGRIRRHSSILAVNMNKPFGTGLMWFRRDLRAEDNAALFHALKSCQVVHCAFVFDRDILDALPRADRRVEFIRESLVAAGRTPARAGRAPGRRPDRAPRARPVTPSCTWPSNWVRRRFLPTTTTSRQPLARDAKVLGALAAQGIAFHTAKDHVIFERDEVLTQSGTPVRRVHALQERLAQEADAVLPASPTRRSAGAGALAPRPAHPAAGARRWTTSASSPPTCAALQIPTGAAGRSRVA